jgi:hypothetical protein
MLFDRQQGCALPRLHRRLPGLVQHRRRLPGLPDLAALAQRLRLADLREHRRRLALGRRPVHVLRVWCQDLGHGGHHLRPHPHPHTADGVVPRLLDARTTPAPARSPANPASARPSWPATSTTTGSSTPSACKPSPRCANSATASSASCTAASRPPQATTRTRPGLRTVLPR